MSDQTPVRLPEARIAEMQNRRESLLTIQTWRTCDCAKCTGAASSDGEQETNTTKTKGS